MTSHHSNNLEIITDESPNISRDTQKRRGYLEWDEYFMSMTFLELRRRPGEFTSDAAIILNDRKIIISMASGSLPREESTTNNTNVSHAEYKALQNIQEGHVMYTTSFPCDKCAQTIAHAGISEVVYYHDNRDNNKAKHLLEESGVTYRQFFSRKKKIEIDFSQVCD